VQNGNDLYQQGLGRETAGDMQGAIQIFERIVRDFSSNRALTARALLQLGRWSELLQQQQARAYYERVIREFAGQRDQRELVAEARTRLRNLELKAPEVTRTAMTVRPVLGFNGELLAVSPDDTQAIVMDYTKGENLAVYDFSSRKRRLLTGLDWFVGQTYFAAWSPDSRSVAYQHVTYRVEQMKEPAFDLRVVTLTGESYVVHHSEGSSVVQPVGWTPDGATLVVVVQRPDKSWAVGTLPATGGDFTPLRSLGWSYHWIEATPRLSPDGRFIVYLEGERGLRHVHVVSLDGRNAHRITDDPGDDFAPLWSPDGRRLAFTRNRLGAVSLWTVAVEDGKPVGSAVKLKEGMQSAHSIDWTKRGIFFGQQTNTRDLYTVPVDPIDGHATGSPRLIPFSRTGRNLIPAWSPDGEKLAFMSSALAQPNARYVVVMPADGGEAREFPIPTRWENSQAPSDLRWFGDGRGLGFSGISSRGVPSVFRLVLETGEWETIPLSGEDYRPQTRTEWNTDGSVFYFARSRSGNAGVFERAANGGAERLIYRPSTPVIAFPTLEFGPDRKSLAFDERTAEANNKLRTRIVILDVETGKARTLMEEVTQSADPWPFSLMSWTPSGDLLVRRNRASLPKF
jgi:Tol biopolymer transport system component